MIKLAAAIKIAALTLALASTAHSDAKEDKKKKAKFLDTMVAPAGRPDTHACSAVLGVDHCCTTEAVKYCINAANDKFMHEDTLFDKDAKCAYVKSAILCYPECVCDSTVGSIQSQVEDLEANYTNLDCNTLQAPKCGAGSMLAPGVALASVGVVLAKSFFS